MNIFVVEIFVWEFPQFCGTLCCPLNIHKEFPGISVHSLLLTCFHLCMFSASYNLLTDFKSLGPTCSHRFLHNRTTFCGLSAPPSSFRSQFCHNFYDITLFHLSEITVWHQSFMFRCFHSVLNFHRLPVCITLATTTSPCLLVTTSVDAIRILAPYSITLSLVVL